jgi:ABC-type spermidine/putrescine transport system permease subunit I
MLPYAGFSPAAVLFGVFFLAPLALIVAYSFWEVVDYNIVHNWTLDNYRYFFSTSTYVTTFLDTLWVAAVATFLTLLAAFPLAYWLARYVRAGPPAPAAAAGDPAVLDQLSAASHLVDHDSR